MRTDKPGVTQVYYATSTGTDIAKNNVPSVDCQGDGLWHEYVVKLAGLKNFKGELRTLRLDPVNGNQAVGAKVEIHWIRLVRRPN
jgi:hypothetical protein